MKLELEPLRKAAMLVTQREIVKACGVTDGAFVRWRQRGLPRTEFTGETNYCKIIERKTKGFVKRKELLAWTVKKIEERELKKLNKEA